MTEQGDTERGKGIKSIWRSFKIIDIIKQEGPIRSTAVAEQMDCSQSTVHYYLKTLEDCDYLIRGEQGYTLGIRFLHLGGHALISRDLYRALNGEVHALALEVGESVQVAVEEYGVGYYVEQATDKSVSRTTRHVGAKFPIHSTAAGKAILSEFPPERVDEIIEQHGLQTRTDQTLADRDELLAELQQIREHGVAYEAGEFLADESGVAVPLMRDSEVVGALELALPLTRIPDPRQSSKEARFPEALVDRVKETAQTIENSLVA